MRVLLDTNALIWAMTRVKLLSPAAAATIADGENTIMVSAASAWEIATKVRIGKLPVAEPLEEEFLTPIAGAGYTLIQIDEAVALLARRLTAPHRDPFDRMIAAHALHEDMPVVSADEQLDQFGVRRIW